MCSRSKLALLAVSAALAAGLAIAVVVAVRQTGRETDWLPTFDSADAKPDLTLPLTVHGPLVREGHCLYANYSDRRVLLAFPPYASWAEATNTLVMDPDRYPVGSETDGINGAGILPADKIPWRVKPEASCDTSRIFLVLLSNHRPP